MLTHSERTHFAYKEFIQDVKRHYHRLPPINTDLTMIGRISRETGIDKFALKYAFDQDQVRSFDTVLRLAGWAGLYLDEYRRE